MFSSRSSAAGVRFFASIREGRGLKPSVRAAGVSKETGYRWLREEFLLLRADGLGFEAAQSELGFASARAADWERIYQQSSDDAGRHHLQVRPSVESLFWDRYLGGQTLTQARTEAQISRSTANRWLHRRYGELRTKGASPATCRRRLRLSADQASRYESAYQKLRRSAVREQKKAQAAAVRASAAHVQSMLQPRARSAAQIRLAEREDRYWELMRQGVNNTQACRILGMPRQAGGRLRRRHDHQIPPRRTSAAEPALQRYLSLVERLQIADLLALDQSLRGIAQELGRSPSTIKRELDRHRDGQGRYLPHTADQVAIRARSRPREHKLVANPRLRKLVQGKLNRRWSPQQISGWLQLRHGHTPQMRLCPETIYRALLLPGDRGLHKRYCAKLRTGRKIRKSRWLTGPGHGSVVRNMTMIDQRPAEVETKTMAGHWEGDLIVGAASASAMMTLRERKTHYGILVNLPLDHTASTLNEAIVKAFSSIPAHLTKTLTWDQGVEMARHQELTAKTGIDIYFAQRSSPWQRGANENYNGLVRQYFPKGTNLAVHSASHVHAVMTEINQRPRKSLGYRTPAAQFRREINSPSKQHALS